MPKPNVVPMEDGHPSTYLFTDRERELVQRRKMEADAAAQMYHATVMTIAELNQLVGKVQLMPGLDGLILAPLDQEKGQ